MIWTDWKPRERATLCFIVADGRIMLIHKKRGLGGGKVNGPGGRLEPGEAPIDGAIRETIEETGVRPIGLEQVGEVSFQFLDGYSLHCTVFIASGCVGTPFETDEALPFWCGVHEAPYGQMWEDDRHWLPLLLARERFAGFFVFDGEAMQSMEIRRFGPLP
ncbi:MAG TPA: NUDIX domain-containing protein [Chthoniobacteraceae bacterium]|nr:NUDIX domain-containing protein [Chthoniobacteraceae bacterium]